MQHPLPKTIFKFIWHFLRPHKSIVIIYAFLAVNTGFGPPFNSILIKNFINILPNVSNGDISILIFPSILIVLNFILFDNFSWRSINYISAKFVPLIVNRVITETIEYVLSHSNQFYQNNLSGKLSKQISNLADGISRIIIFSSVYFLRGVSLLLTEFITSYSVNPLFCFIQLVWFTFFSGISIFMSKKLVKLSDYHAEKE
ncbi:ABC transporter transmembrane domain-containing protein [Cardinium endosymbiont of Bemisia tabaci]|uniref:ABC transporter transmembrane domain-containing protein n=1 Tax=Cardinium endosymbiont of Bemisia tabaci TaxID=672794 RepID=UPI0006899FD4|nr:ABC transporter transmembrane domain-containing protein [Cardinium endosymbiont of Bemisia tabaci]